MTSLSFKVQHLILASLLLSKRKCKMILATGVKGVGKSYATIQWLMDKYVRGNPALGQAPRRVIILDVNDEYGEFGIKSIQPEHIPLFCIHPLVEIRRLRPFKIIAPAKAGEKPRGVRMKTNEILELLSFVLENFTGGLLLIEDINKYVKNNLPDDLAGAICTNRHINCDIIMHYQSCNRPLPQIWENTDEVRFHYQETDVFRAESKLQEKTERFKLAQLIVEAKYFKGDERFYVWITDKRRLAGDFTKEDFMFAAKEYLLSRPKEMKRFVDERTEEGKKKYTYPQALQQGQERLFMLYWGNTPIQAAA